VVNAQRPFLIDTDGGVDDALALLLASHSPEIDLIGVTTVMGNTGVGCATTNVLRVLGIARVNVPVYEGAAKPLSGSFENPSHIHGEDGLGNLSRFVKPDGSPRYGFVSTQPIAESAVDFILDTARKHGEALTLVALGPLTNLAEACKRDVHAMQSIGSIVIMGGAIGCPGNVTPVSEFNFYADPLAAHNVLGSGLSVTLVDLGATSQALFERSIAVRGLEGYPCEQSQFIVDSTELYSHFYEEAEGVPGFFLHDPLAVGVAINSHFATMEQLHVVVEPEGFYSKGFSIADLRARWDKRVSPPNCSVVRAVDTRAFLRFFCERLWPGLRLLD
jgi:purine nucleosidase/pyrimidine-specific ribonucleoside hydrolase